MNVSTLIEKEYASLQEAADILGVHYSTVARYVLDGRLKGQKLGWQVFVSRAALRKFKRPPMGKPSHRSNGANVLT